MLRSKSKLMQICLLAASLFMAQAAFANAVGTVIFKTGDVSVTHIDNSVTAAEKNAPLNNGDTIETRDGRVQFSFIDGGKVSLQPNTIFKIKKYEFSGKEDGNEYALTELVKGGLRTISGLIGHKNRERYQLKTTVATIGIRGTEFTVNFNGDVMLMTTNHGSVDVCSNDGACLNAITGQTIAVSAAGGPKFSSEAAKAAAAAPASGKAVFAASETNPLVLPSSTTPSANPSTTPAVNLSGSGTVISLAVETPLAVNPLRTVNYEVANANSQIDTTGKLTDMTANSNGSNRHIQPVSFSNFNNDGVIAWGQATGGTYTSGNNTPSTMARYDYIAGATPTPSNLATLSGTYNVFASTVPFLVTSSSATSTVGAINTTTGSFKFDFSGAGLYNYNLYVSASNEIFNLTGNGIGLKPNNPSFINNGAISSSGTSCQTGCTSALQGSLIQGSFLGANGQRIGLQYGFSVPSLNGNVYGGAVLK